MGNIHSIWKKFKMLGIEAIVSNEPSIIKTVDKIILPGVGHFAKAMQKLKNNNLDEVLHEEILIKKKNILGICLGMQLMCKYSEEGNVEGLGWFEFGIKKFNISDKYKYKVPHIGWNTIKIENSQPLITPDLENQEFYFVHSFCAVDVPREEKMTTSEYEDTFVSAIYKNHIYGVQFHPEKSHDCGMKLFKNFIQL